MGRCSPLCGGELGPAGPAPRLLGLRRSGPVWRPGIVAGYTTGRTAPGASDARSDGSVPRPRPGRGDAGGALRPAVATFSDVPRAPGLPAYRVCGPTRCRQGVPGGDYRPALTVTGGRWRCHRAPIADPTGEAGLGRLHASERADVSESRRGIGPQVRRVHRGAGARRTAMTTIPIGVGGLPAGPDGGVHRAARSAWCEATGEMAAAGRLGVSTRRRFGSSKCRHERPTSPSLPFATRGLRARARQGGGGEETSWVALLGRGVNGWGCGSGSVLWRGKDRGQGVYGNRARSPRTGVSLWTSLSESETVRVAKGARGGCGRGRRGQVGHVSWSPWGGWNPQIRRFGAAVTEAVPTQRTRRARRHTKGTVSPSARIREGRRGGSPRPVFWPRFGGCARFPLYYTTPCQEAMGCIQ